MFLDTFRLWLRDPIVAPLFILLVLTLAILVLTVARAIQSGTFDATLLPRFLRDYLLADWIPLAALGLVVWVFGAVYPEGSRDLIQTLGLGALSVTYATGIAAAVAKYVVKLTELVRGPAPGLLTEIDQPVTGQ